MGGGAADLGDHCQKAAPAGATLSFMGVQKDACRVVPVGLPGALRLWARVGGHPPPPAQATGSFAGRPPPRAPPFRAGKPLQAEAAGPAVEGRRGGCGALGMARPASEQHGNGAHGPCTARTLSPGCRPGHWARVGQCHARGAGEGATALPVARSNEVSRRSTWHPTAGYRVRIPGGVLSRPGQSGAPGDPP